ALGEAASGANLAARGFQGMSAGLTIAATGAALAVSILAIMIRTMNEMAVSQAKISIGFKTMNLEGLKSGLLQATTDIEVFTQRSQFLLGRFVNSVSLLMQKFGLAVSPFKEAAEGREAIEKLVPFFQNEMMSKFSGQFAGAEIGFLQTQAGVAEQQGDM